MKYQSNGNKIEAAHSYGNSGCNPNCVTAFNGSAFLAGKYTALEMFIGNFTLTKSWNLGGDEIFVARLDTFLFTNITEQNPELQISIYPNASDGKFNIRFTPSKKNKIGIFDCVGKEIYSSIIFGEKQIDLSECKNGIYFLRVEENSKAIKIIIDH